MKDYKYFKTVLMFILIFFLLLGLSVYERLGILGAIGASSLASSTCIVLIMPFAESASASALFGSYALGFVTGALCFYAVFLLADFFPRVLIEDYNAFFGALAVILTTYFMVLFRIIHPPAAGFSLAMLIDKWHGPILLMVFIYLVVLSIIHFFICRHKLIPPTNEL